MRHLIFVMPQVTQIRQTDLAQLRAPGRISSDFLDLHRHGNLRPFPEMILMMDAIRWSLRLWISLIPVSRCRGTVETHYCSSCVE
jgi:hypothetical protein